MDNNNQSFPGHPLVATSYAVVSVIFGVFASIKDSIDFYVRCGAGLAAITAAFFACRYHWYATKEKLKSLKQKQEPFN